MAVFLREDGQLALGSKTPVSILQEILQKKGMVPQYELLFNGVGTPDPRFKFRVSAEGMTAIGDGKSKKEAKHDAAATLLKRLLSNRVETSAEVAESNEEVDIASPYTGALKTNYVGRLDEISYINKIPAPNYVPVREEGPPHARVFTMRCDLSRISEIAVARTKKQAKHLVAQKMIEKVSTILGDRYIPPLESDDTVATEEVISNREAIQNGTFHHNLTYKVADLHNVFHILKDEQPLPTVFLQLPDKPEEFYESVESPLELLEEVVEALEGVVDKNHVTQEQFANSLKELAVLLKEDESEYDESDEEGDIDSENENQHQPSTFTRVNSIPQFPFSEDEEDNVAGELKNENQNKPSTLIVVDNHSHFPPVEKNNISGENKCENLDVPLRGSDNISDMSLLAIEKINIHGGHTCENYDEPSTLNQVDSLPAFPLLENEENVKAKEEVTSKMDIKTDFEKDIALVHSFIKVEVPRGFWEFVGQGTSNQEALDQAARKALKFLRIMAIPPPQ